MLKQKIKEYTYGRVGDGEGKGLWRNILHTVMVGRTGNIGTKRTDIKQTGVKSAAVRLSKYNTIAILDRMHVGSVSGTCIQCNISPSAAASAAAAKLHFARMHMQRYTGWAKINEASLQNAWTNSHNYCHRPTKLQYRLISSSSSSLNICRVPVTSRTQAPSNYFL